MLDVSGVNLRAKGYFWGVFLAVGALALVAISRLSAADKTDPGKSASQDNSARLEAEIQSLHEELASTKELLRQATSPDDELRLAQRGDGPPRTNNPPADSPKSGAKSTDDKKFDADAWRALDKELAPRHPGMRDGFRGGPPPWADRDFRDGPPWAHHRGHGHGGPPWAHHHHRHGHHRWAHRHRHGHHRGWHHWQHDGRGGGPSPWDRGDWARRGPGGFGPGPRGGECMVRIAERLNLLERKIDALMREIRGPHEGPDRGGPQRDGPPHDGPPRDGPPRDGGSREAAPPRRPGE